MIKPNLLFLVWPLIGVVVLLAGSGVAYAHFRVTDVKCFVSDEADQPSLRPCPSEVSILVNSFRDVSLLGTHFEERVNLLVDGHQLPYELHSLRKEAPSTLTLYLRQDPFVYQVREVTTDKKWLVTDHGWLRSQEEGAVSLTESHSLLPQITQVMAFPSTAVETRRVDPATHDLIQQLLQALDVYEIEYQRLILYDPVTSIVVLNDTQHVLLENDRLLENLERLTLLFANQSQLPIPSTVVEYDVRFKLPVLRTDPTFELP